MNKQVSALLQREVSRQEFLGISALAIASVLGFGSIIKMLTGLSLESHHVVSSSAGYGSSAYGGRSRV